MSESPNSAWEIRLKIANTVIAALLLFGVWLAYLSLKSDHEQRRRQVTMHLWNEWRDVLDTGSARRSLEMIRSGQITDSDLVYIAKGEPVPPEDVTPPVSRVETGNSRSKHTRDGVHKIRTDIVAILNLFEQIAVAYRDDVGDPEMIKRYFGLPIAKNRHRLQKFVQEWTENEYSGGWPALDQVINDHWSESLDKEPPLP